MDRDVKSAPSLEIIQCVDCCRDAVPRAFITKRGDVYCESCFDPNQWPKDAWTDVTGDDPETIKSAVVIYCRNS